ncbi:hypothetical protein [Actinomadura madurae]|uniref:hypothetical protein n=1 Tax=Actinomadura madurae TaxID=1993 RepID=UPI0020D201E8|nr:hypothetical protein [Actinomadura madurae]MCQ0019997.1 hypothetical protein [Actinomadura madurae]
MTADAEWVTSVYSLVFAALLIPFGRAGRPVRAAPDVRARGGGVLGGEHRRGGRRDRVGAARRAGPAGRRRLDDHARRRCPR